jgi:periplasmic protein TonB
MIARISAFCLWAAAGGCGAAALAQPAPPVAAPKMQECTGGYQPPVMIRTSLMRMMENYPSKALREEAEGVVGVAITVGVDGRAFDVEITQRAESEDLNIATIQGVTRYGRFYPALQDCKPVIGELTTAIRWAIPG